MFVEGGIGGSGSIEPPEPPLDPPLCRMLL